MFKKTLCFIFAFLFSVGICSCSSKEDNKNTDPKIIDIEILQKTMLKAAPSLSNNISVNSNSEQAKDTFTSISDLDYDSVQSYFICYSKDTVADEIALICVKDKKDVQTALESLENHAEQKMSLFSDYSAKNTEKFSAFTTGNYAVLIICNEASSVKKAFEDTIK